MNSCYKLVYSETLNAWVAVSEHVNARGKKGTVRLLAAVSLLASGGLGAGMAWAAPPVATQLPTGAQVAAGTVNISQTQTATAASMAIAQSSNQAIVNWQSFNVGANAKVNISQPSSTSVLLNRVQSSDPSQIFGQINANGQVFLTNPNGVYFAPGSRVDVGSFAATTHSITDADFLKGNYQFNRNGATGSVVNEGHIAADLGGYIALLAPEVRNQGVVVAQMGGSVALAAGESFQLQFGSNKQLTNVLVTPSTLNTLVENGNAVQAPGGLIILSAQAASSLLGGVVKNTGTLAATGLVNDGGVIRLTASNKIELAPTSNISADAVPNSAGKGGRIEAIADLANPSSLMQVDGALSAKGGEQGGDGGFIETSGARLKIADTVRVSTLAPGGKSGEWLLDPTDFTIAATGGDMTGTVLTSSLAGGDVTITSTSGASGTAGNINVLDAVSWSSHTLTLNSGYNINVGSSSTTGSLTVTGTGSLSLNPSSNTVTGWTAGGAVLMGMATSPTSGSTGGYLSSGSFGSGAATGFNGQINVSTSGTVQIGGTTYSVVNSEADFVGMASGGNYVIGSHLGFSTTYTAAVVASFTGKLDAFGHVISGLDINNSGANWVGLFSTSSGSTVRNLGVSGSIVAASGVGTIAGNGFGGMAISRTYSTVTVATANGSLVGGFVGLAGGVSISESYVTGDVSGGDTVGGMVGFLYPGTITSSYATGAVFGTANAGGLVGSMHSNSTISNSFATGNVTAMMSNGYGFGGLVAYIPGSSGVTISNSYATGAVQNNTGVVSVATRGGLVGQVGTAQFIDSYWNSTANPSFDVTTGGIGATVTATSGVTALSTAAMKSASGYSSNFGNTSGAFTAASGWGFAGGVNGGFPVLCAISNCTSYSNSFVTATYIGTAGGLWSAGANWDLGYAPTSSNSDSVTYAVINSGYSVRYDTASVGSTSFAIQNAGAITFTGLSNVTLSGVISGAGSLTKEGSSTVTLSGANTYSGGTTVSAGVLQASSTTAFGSGTISVASGAALDLYGQTLTSTGALSLNGSGISSAGALTNSSATPITYGGAVTLDSASTIGGTGNVTLSGGISGAHALTINGGAGQSATVTLSGANAVSTINITTGTLQIGDGSTSGSLTGDVVNDGVLAFNRSDALTYSGNVSGSGTVSKLGAGTTTLSGDNTYTGVTTISAGTLQVGGGGTSGSLVGDVANNAILAFNRSDALTYSGVISGTGSLTQAGAGTTTLSGANTYSGGTTISAGTLAAGSATAVGTGAVAIASAATLDLTYSGTVALASSLNMTSGAAITNSANTSSLSVAGTSTLTGAVTTAGSQTYTGAVTLGAATTLSTLDTNSANTNAAVAFGSTVDGVYALNITNGSGDVSFGSTLGATTPLTSLTITGGGTATAQTTTLGGNVTTSGLQSYGGNLILGSNAVLTSTNSDVTIEGAVTTASMGGLTVQFLYSSEYIYNSTTYSIGAGPLASSISGSSGTYSYTLPSASSWDYLIVGGGGGGGYYGGGGGGGGGVLAGSASLTSGSYTITIGSGGAGSQDRNYSGSNGNSSSLSGPSAATSFNQTALGGGGGGSNTRTPGSSGSGGGAGIGYADYVSGTSGQGNAGGYHQLNNGSPPFTNGVSDGVGGGGGGGASNWSAYAAGNGGDGAASSITGTLTYYAGGGGGSINGTAGGSGGLGGGGSGGGSSSTYLTAGTANTGGGGGGAYTNYSAASGGSGIVILSSSALRGAYSLTINSGTGTTNINGSVSDVTNLTINSTSAGSTVKGAISGATAVAYNTAVGYTGTSGAAGILGFAGANTYTGGTTISGGTLQVGAGGSIGSIAGDVINNATLAFNRSDALTYSGVISGTGAVTQAGTGTTTLSGANTYSGDTMVSTGTLQAGSATAFGTGAVSVVNGAALDLNGQTMTSTGALTLSGTGVSSAGALRNSSNTGATYAGLVTLGADSSIVGDTGAIYLSNTGNIAGTYGLTLGGAAGGSVASVIDTSAGTVTKEGAGTWTLTAANTYTGETTVSAGTLAVTNAAGLGGTGSGTTVASGAALDLQGAAVGLEAITLNGGTLAASTGTSSLSGSVTLAADSTASVAGTQLTLSGTVSGTGVGLTKTGTGTLAMSGTNTYTGGTTISAGTLTAGSAAAVGTGAVSIASAGTLDLTYSGTVALGSSLSMASGAAITNSANTSSLSVAGASTLAGTVTTAGSQTYTGAATLGAATTLTTLDSSSANTNAAVAFGSTVDGAYALTITNGSGNVSFGASVGATAPLASLTVTGGASATAQTTTLAGNVTTSGNQTYGGALTLGANTALTSTANGGNGAVTIAGAVNTVSIGGSEILEFLGNGYWEISTNSGSTWSYYSSNGSSSTYQPTVTIGGVTYTSSASALSSAPSITYSSNTYSWTPTATTNASYLIVGGGGGGGWYIGGGGGGGGVLQSTTALNLPVTTYSIVVGNGGAGALYSGSRGSIGSSSSIIGGSVSLIAYGGGGGGTGNNASRGAGTGSADGAASGGGGARGYSGGTGLAGQGNGGGSNTGVGLSDGLVAGGGGGGGSSGSGAGGAGAVNLITGSNIGQLSGGNYYVAGGGAGSTDSTSVISGGLGGGGSSPASGQKPTSGTANTGGGGGGSWHTFEGASGGSGAVVLSGNLNPVQNAYSLTINSGTGRAAIGGSVSNITTLAINSTAANSALSGAIAGSTAVAYNSAAGYTAADGAIGVLNLAGTNTYTGGTVVSGGTLQAGSSAAFGANTSAITVHSDAALDIYGQTLVNTNALTLNGTGVASGGALTNSSSNAATYAGLITLASATTINAPSGNIAITNPGTITGAALGLTLDGANTASSIASILGTTSGALTKAGTGTWTLSGTNTYTGATTIDAGTLAISNAAGLGTTAGGVTVASGATLDLQAVAVGNEAVTLNGGTLATSTGTSSLSGAVTMDADSTADVSGTQLTLSGVVSGTGFGLSKTGAGILVLSGTNTYTGATTISAGTLQVGAGGTSGSIAGDVTNNSALTFNRSDAITYSGVISGTGALTQSGAGTTSLEGANTYSGGTTVSAGTLQAGSATAFGAGAIAVASGAALDLNGQTMTSTGGLTLSGTGVSSGGALLNSSSTEATYAGLVTLAADTSIVGDAGAIALTNSGDITGTYALTLGGATGGSIAGVIDTGSGTVTKEGTGTWLLSGANTYTGDTTINAGTLAITNASGLGDTGAGTTVASGATLDLQGVAVGAEAITLNGGTLAASTGTSSLSGSVTMGADSIVDVAGTASELTLSGLVSGAYALTKSGSGNVILSNQNTFSGGLTITDGTATAGTTYNGTSGPFGSGTVTVQTGGTLDINNYSVYAPISLGGGALVNNATSGGSGQGEVLLGVTLTADSMIGGAGYMNISTAVTSNGYGLVFLGTGTKNLSNASNTLTTIASGSGVGELNVLNNAALTIGEVTAGGSTYSGINATGTVSVVTTSGDLTISESVVTTSTSSSSSQPALKLSAGSSSAAGTSDGGELVLVDSPTVSIGSGGLALLYSGAASSSNGIALANLLSSKASSNTEYNGSTSDALTVLTGFNATFRESPTIVYLRPVDSQSSVYGTAPTSLSYCYTSSASSCAPVSYAGIPTSAQSFSLTNSAVSSVVSVSGGVSGSLVLSGPSSVASGLSATTNAGTYALTLQPTLTLAGYVFKAATAVDYTVNPKVVTVTNTARSTTYDGLSTYASLANGTSYTVSGLVGQDAVRSVTQTASGTSVVVGNVAGAGSFTVTPSVAVLSTGTPSNYSFTYADALLTVDKAPLTVTVNNDARFIGESDATGYNGASYSGFVANQSALVLGGALSINRSNTSNAAGTYTGVLKASGLSSSNYSLTYVDGGYTIVPADQLLIRLSDTSTTYGTAPSYTVSSVQYKSSTTNSVVDLTSRAAIDTAAFTLDDGVGGETALNLGPLSASLSSAGQLAAGSYQLGATSVTNTSANYSDTVNIVGALTVGKKGVTVEATSGLSKTYDGTTTLSNLGFGVTGLVGVDAVTASGRGTYADANVGTGKTFAVEGVSLSGADAANYKLAAGNTFNATSGVVTAAPLLVTANNASKTYDALAYTAAAGVTYSGFVNNETTSVIGGSLAYGGTSLGATNAGTYVITPSGLTSSNYAISFANGALTISPADVTVSATTVALSGTVGKVYDGSNTATLVPGNYVLTGFLGSDGATITQTSGTYDTANAGTGKWVSVALASSDYAAKGVTNLSNYVLPSSVAGYVGVISAKPVTLTNTVGSSTYDGVSTYATAAAATLFTANGLVGSDEVTSVTQTSSGHTGSASGAAQVGAFTVMPSAAVLGTGTASNYSFTYASGTHTVAPLASVVFTGASGSNWSSASNWAGGAIPTLGNVTLVQIPTGTTVVYDQANLSGLTPTSAIDIASSGSLSVVNASDMSLPGGISGTGALSKNGVGTLTLSGSHTYSGSTAVNAGALRVTGALPNSAVSVASGSSYYAAASHAVGSLSGAGSVVLETGVTLSTGADNSSTSLSGAVSGAGALTKEGTGTFTVSGSNLFTGGVSVNAGTLQTGSATAMGTGAVSVAIGAGLDLNGISVANALTLSGTGASAGGSSGALFNSSANAAAVSGAITLAADTLIKNTGALSLSTIDGAYALTVRPTGTLTLAGDIGLTSAPTSLSAVQNVAGVAGTGTTAVGAVTVKTSGAQTYGNLNISTSLTSPTTLRTLGGDLKVLGAINADRDGGNLVVDIGLGNLTLGSAQLDLTTGSLDLSAAANRLSKLAIPSAGYVEVANTTPLELGTSFVSGSLTLGNKNADITQSGFVRVMRDTLFEVDAAAITLDMAGAPGNMFGGTLGRLTLINSGDNDIKIYTPGSLRLDHIDTGTGSLDLRAADIRQSNASASVKMRGTVTSNNTELIFDAPITLDAPLSIDAGTGTLTLNSTLAAGTNTLTVKADALDLSNATLSGSSFALTTSTAGKSIVLGSTTDSSAMAISSSDFTKLMAMDSLSIGDSTSTNPITVSSALTVSKPMTVTITAGGSFTVNDQITVSNGTFTVAGSGHTTYLNADIVTAGQAVYIQDSVILGANVKIDTTNGGTSAGAAVTIAEVSTGVGGTVNSDSSSTRRNLTVTAGTGAATFAGIVGGSVALGALDVTAAGGISLPAAVNTYGTQTYRNAVSLPQATTLTSNDYAVAFASTVNSASATAQTLTVAAGTGDITFSDAVGAAYALGGLTLSGATITAPAIALSGDLDVSNTAASTISGVVSGTGGLSKAGSGTLALSGANTYASDTTVSAGTLQLAGSASLGGGSYAGDISLASGAVLQFSSDALQTLSGTISGAGGFIKDTATGTLILSGSNTYSGGTTISTGTLQTANSSALGTAAVAVGSSGSSAASLDLNGNSVGNTLTLYGYGSAGEGGSVGALTNSSTTAATASGTVTLGSATTLGGSGDLTVSGAVGASGNGLAFVGAGATTLSNSTNTLSTIATDAAVGALSVTNNAAMTVGTVTLGSTSYSGVSSTDAVAINTTTGDLTISSSVATTGSSLVVGAGSATAAGTSSGGDVLLSGSPTLTVGTGGSAIIYSGSVSGSTGVTATVGSGSGKFRYNSQQGSTNYTAALGTGLSAVYREQPTLTISVDDAAGIVYGNSSPSFTTTVSGQNGDTAAQALSTAATVTAGGTTSSAGYLTAGTHTLTAAGAVDQLGYALAYATNTLTITPASLSVTGLTASNKTYDSTTAATLGGTAAISVLGSDSVTLGGSAVGSFADKNAGSAKAITVSGNTISGTDAANYTLAQQSGLSADITPASLSVTGLTASNKTYDSTTAATLGGTAAISVLGSDSVTLGGSAVGSFADKNAGSAKAITVSGNTISGTDAANYTLAQQSGLSADITPASLSVTGLTASNKTYDSTTAATLGGTAVISVLGNDSVTLGGSAVGSFADKNAGSAKAITVSGNTISGTDAANYTLAQQSGLSADITPASLSVTGLTASNKTYDSTTAATLGGTAAISVLGSDSVTLGGSAVGSFADKNAGSAKAITVSGNTISGTDAANYTLAQQSGLSADITPASLSVTGLTASNKTYDSTTAATLGGTAAISVLGSDSVTLGGSAVGSFADKNAGSAKAIIVSGNTISGTDAANYTLAQQSGLSADITPASLSVTGLTASNKTYDSTTAATLGGTAAISVLGSDSVTLGGSAVGSFADKNAGSAKAITVSGNTISGTDAANYTLAQQSGLSADITPASLSVTGLTASNKTYDSTTAATLGGTAAISVLGSDSVTLGGSAVGSFADKNAGSAKAITVSGNTISGTDAANYTLAQQSGLSADITPASLSVTGLTASNKTYDSTTAATLGGTAVISVLGNDSVTLGGSAVGSFADKNAGSAKAITVSGNTISGTDAANYTLAQQSGLSADITPASLSVTGLTASNKTYDSTTAATLGGTAAISVLGSDSVTLGGSAVGSFADKNAGSAKAITVSGNTISGTDAANYTLAQQSGLSADIVAMPVVVTTPTTSSQATTGSVLPTLTVSLSTNTVVGPATTVQAVVSSASSSATATASVQAGSSSAGVSVSTINSPTQQTNGLVSVLVPAGTTTAGAGLVIALPEAVTLNTQSADLTVSVTLPNNQPLPSWIRYDAQTNTLVTDAVPASAFPLSIVVTVGGQSTLIQVSESQVNL